MKQDDDFMESADEAQKLIDDQVTEQDMTNNSEIIEGYENQAALFAALSRCQGELEKATRKATADTGKFSYNYSTIGEILDVARKPMSNNGLAIIQMPTFKDGIVSVNTTITHEKGGYLDSTLSIPVVVPVNAQGQPVMNEAQACGSVITYARRYQLAGFLGISQEDSDGHGDSKGTAKRMASIKQQEFVKSLIKKNWNWADFAAKYGITKLSDLDAATASDAIEELNTMTKPQGAKK